MRALFILLLLVSVHAKLVDLDCALTNPLHCQTLFESGDNSFSHPACAPVLPPVILAYVGPALVPVTVAPACKEAEFVPRVCEVPAESRRRPPPVFLT